MADNDAYDPSLQAQYRQFLHDGTLRHDPRKRAFIDGLIHRGVVRKLPGDPSRAERSAPSSVPGRGMGSSYPVPDLTAGGSFSSFTQTGAGVRPEVNPVAAMGPSPAALTAPRPGRPTPPPRTLSEAAQLVASKKNQDSSLPAGRFAVPHDDYASLLGIPGVVGWELPDSSRILEAASHMVPDNRSHLDNLSAILQEDKRRSRVAAMAPRSPYIEDLLPDADNARYKTLPGGLRVGYQPPRISQPVGFPSPPGYHRAAPGPTPQDILNHQARDMSPEAQTARDYVNGPRGHEPFWVHFDQMRKDRKAASERVQDSIIPLLVGLATGGYGTALELPSLLTSLASLGASTLARQGQNTAQRFSDPEEYEAHQKRSEAFTKRHPHTSVIWDNVASIPFMSVFPLTGSVLKGKAVNIALGAGSDSANRFVHGKPQDPLGSLVTGAVRDFTTPRLPSPVQDSLNRSIPDSVRTNIQDQIQNRLYLSPSDSAALQDATTAYRQAQLAAQFQRHFSQEVDPTGTMLQQQRPAFVTPTTRTIVPLEGTPIFVPRPRRPTTPAK